jgi:hypothetical protein
MYSLLNFFNMKTLLKLAGFLMVVSIFSVGCTKTTIDTTATDINEMNVFNEAAAKELYYGQFQKSSDNAKQKNEGKKTPVWKNGVYKKEATFEIMEFPLIKQKVMFPIQNDETLSGTDKKRIADASLNRVIFVKTKTKKYLIRELNYIPDWEYLKAKNYDISDVNVASNKFTGRIITKTWDGTVLGIFKIVDGKIMGKIKVLTNNNAVRDNNTTNVTETCGVNEVCQYQRDCDYICYGDNCLPTGECTPWVPTGDCEFNGQPCGADGEENCELYGVNCDNEGDGDGGGGGDDEEEDEEETCDECGNITQAQAAAQLNEITGSCDNTVGIPTIGSSTGPDANGVERKPWASHGCGYSYTRLGLWTSHFAAYYNGMLFKETPSSPWKFETFSFNEVMKDGGDLPPCYGVNISSNIVGGIIDNGLAARGVGSFTLTFKITCTLFNSSGEFRPITENLTSLEWFRAD